MRTFLLSLTCLALAVIARAEPFEIKDGDRVLFLGDTLLEREGTYGYLETRMVEQFPDRHFTVRNLAFSADTPLGWSRASFDPPAKGFERLKEQLALVKPTVVFLGYGMAASLQEMTDRSQDWTLNRDPARYGAEPMSAARFKKELAQCMDLIAEVSTGAQSDGTAADAADAAKEKDAANPATQNPSSAAPAAPAASAAVKKSPVRFVLLSPIRHEDLRQPGPGYAGRPGLPDPTEHNKLLEQYSKAIEELAKARGARFVDLVHDAITKSLPIPSGAAAHVSDAGDKTTTFGFLPNITDNGIHLTAGGYSHFSHVVANALGWHFLVPPIDNIPGLEPVASDVNTRLKDVVFARLRAAIIRKNALFFHRWRPANETYLFGFRKREQGQNAVEIPKFDPLIEAAEAEIERLKKSANAAAPLPNAERRASGRVGVPPAGSGVSPGPSGVAGTPNRNTPSAIERNSAPGGPRETRSPAGGTPTLPEARQSASAATTTAPNTPSDPARQTPAEKPDLSKIPAQSSYDLPTFTLADGLEISLWAENPLLAKPTQCNWDAQGRLWVASSAMYPQIAPGQEASDKIIIIEDPGHTGKGTKSTVFVDGLLIPTGVVPDLRFKNSDLRFGKNAASPTGDEKSTRAAPDSKILNPKSEILNACYVGQSTELLYFEDTDGDGKADKKRIVFSGFGTEDTHHIVHTLRWGPDGRLYFSQSVYIHTHMETPWGVVRVNSGGTFAYDPRTERVEVVAKGLWNTWGHAWDQWGQAFYTDGAGSSGISWGFPGATFAPNEGARRTMASISPGSYPKFAGLELVYSPHFPAEWQGTAVTCDFRAHKIVHFKINDLGATTADAKAGGTAANAAGAARGKDAANPATQNASSSAAPAATAAVNTPKSGYVTEQLPVLVQTSDATFRPIDVKLGPDGALYIADWSNPIINHGEVDFRDPRRDHEHGRIWRLSMKGGAAVKWESLVGKEPRDLWGNTNSENLWTSTQATRLLESAAGKDAEKEESDLEAIAKSSKAQAGKKTVTIVDIAATTVRSVIPIESEDARSVVNAMHLTSTIGDGVLLFSMSGRKNSRSDVRAGFVRILGNESFRDIELRNVDGTRYSSKKAGNANLVTISRFVSDSHPRVRVEAMRALARIPTVESASFILDAAINAPKDDPQYEFAAWLSINDLAEVWTKAVLAGEWKPEGREKQFEFALNAIEPALAGQVLSQFVSTGRAPLDGSGPWIELIGNTGGPGELRPLLDGLLAATKPDGDNMKPLADAKWKFKTPGANARAAAALLAAARRGVKPAGDATGQLTPAAFFTHAPTDALPDVLRLAGLWKQNVPAAIFTALDTRASAPVLDAAFDALRTLATPDAADFLTAYFDPAVEQKLNNASLRKVIAKSDNNWRIHALTALAPLRPDAALKHLDTVLAGTPEPQRVNVWRTLFAEGPFMQKFMQSIPANFPPATAATALRAARELGRRGQPLVAKLSPLAGEKAAATTAPADYNELAARAKKDGDPVAGEAIYRRMASACTTCHAIGGAGGKLGPDMTSIGASAPPDYIIESILNPAAKVKEGYHAFSFAMKDGSEAIGIPSRETPQEQFIRTLAGEQALPKANIVSKKIAEGGASLMPAGLTAAWGDRERLNLYAFLMELGRPGPFDASKNNVARVWMLTESAKVDGALKPEPSSAVTPLLPAYTLVDGRLTKDLLTEKLAILQPKNATVHLTARFQAASAGKAKLNLTGIRKAWLDGQPLAIASEPSPSVDLSAGAHNFTVEVDAKSPPDVLRLESPAASFLGD